MSLGRFIETLTLYIDPLLLNHAAAMTATLQWDIDSPSVGQTKKLFEDQLRQFEKSFHSSFSSRLSFITSLLGVGQRQFSVHIKFVSTLLKTQMAKIYLQILFQWHLKLLKLGSVRQTVKAITTSALNNKWGLNLLRDPSIETKSVNFKFLRALQMVCQAWIILALVWPCCLKSWISCKLFRIQTVQSVSSNTHCPLYLQLLDDS